MLIRIVCISLLVSVLPIVGRAQTTRLDDSSDWWSILRMEEDINGPDKEVKSSSKPIKDTNLRIAGIALREASFKQVTARFGKAAEVERGDAASGRTQVCYVSVGEPKIHFIFETGEVESIFYLFAGGKNWNGADQCVKSSLVSADLATHSGLKVGLERPKVEAILGPPDAVSDNRMLYLRQVQTKTSPSDLVELRKRNPRMSDQEFHANYDFYTVTVFIEARLENQKVQYLAISESEVY